MVGRNEGQQCLPEYLKRYFQKAENGFWHEKIVAGIIKYLAEKGHWDQIWIACGAGEEDIAREAINTWEVIIKEGNNPAQIVNMLVAHPTIKLWWDMIKDNTIETEIKKDWRKIVCKNFADKGAQ